MPDMCWESDPRFSTIGAGSVGRVEEEIAGIAMAGITIRTAGSTSQKRGALMCVTILSGMGMARVHGKVPDDSVGLSKHLWYCIDNHQTSSLAPMRVCWRLVP